MMIKSLFGIFAIYWYNTKWTCTVIFAVIAFYLCDGCEQVEMEIKTVACTSRVNLPVVTSSSVYNGFVGFEVIAVKKEQKS